MIYFSGYGKGDKNMNNERTIKPNPPANFTPQMRDYKTLRPFRYWCQKVLPLVYDDSLSYYELLCKVVDYLNKTMEDVDTLHGDVTNLHNAYVELQGYVNNYFSNLDVQEEINKKLDEMFENGELGKLLTEAIQKYHCGYINIREFGAKCDGVTDDSEAIQNAVNNLITLDNNEISRRVLLIPAFTVITKPITIPFGLIKIKGYSLNESRVICNGNGCFIIGDTDLNTTNHELEIEDIYFRGDSNNSYLLQVNKISNVTFRRVHVSHCGAGCYSIVMNNCGIINITECIIEGGEDTEALPGNRNGISIDIDGSQLNITKCNIWNLNKFLTLSGSVQLINMNQNWCECIKSVIDVVQTKTDMRYMHFNIDNNFINIHNYKGFVLDNDFSFLHFNTDNSAEIFNTVIRLTNNQMYFWSMSSLKENSIVTFNSALKDSIVYFIYSGNILTGRTLSYLNSYVYKSSENIIPHFLEFSVTNNIDYLQYSDNATVASLTVGRNTYYGRIIDRLEFSDYNDASKYGAIRFSGGKFYTKVDDVDNLMPIRIKTNNITGYLNESSTIKDIVDRINQLTIYCSQSLLFTFTE